MGKTKLKRLLCFVLSLALVFTLVSFPAYAEEETDAEAAEEAVSEDVEEVDTEALQDDDGIMLLMDEPETEDPTDVQEDPTDEETEEATEASGEEETEEPTEAATDASVAKIGDDTYATLADAVAAAPTDGTVTEITLTADTAESAGITIASGQNIVLDLAGFTVDMSTHNVYSYGTLTIQDSTMEDVEPEISDDYETVTYESGKITSTVTTVYARGGGTVNLVSGTVESTNVALYAWGDKTGTESITSTVNVYGGYVVAQEFAISAQGLGATLNIEGGVMVANDNAVIGGNGQQVLGGTEITISGGTLIGHIQSTGYVACGIYHPQSGTLTITGGTIYAEGGCGILMRGGTLDMSGGTIITTAASATGMVGDSRIVVDASGIIYDLDSGYYDVDNVEIELSGDVVIDAADGSNAIKVVDEAGTSYEDGTITVSGGTYSSSVSTYLAEGVTLVDNGNGTYTAANYVASIGDEKYASLAEAVAAANAADAEVTITLLADVEIDSSVIFSGNANTITLDLNGKAITRGESTSTYLIGVASDADLLVTDSSNDGSGSIDATFVVDGTTYTSYGILTNGELTIEAGTVSGQRGVYVSGDNASLTVNGGTVSGSNYGVYQNSGTTTVNGGTVSGTYGIYVSGGNATVTDGTVTGTQRGISMSSNATSSKVTISGGTVYGTLYGIVQFAGEIEITGGTITGNTYHGIQAGGTLTVNGESAKISGGNAGIYVTGSVEIISGTIEGKSGVYVYDGGKVTIGTEGSEAEPTITGSYDAVEIKTSASAAASSEVTIYSGTLKSDTYGIVMFGYNSTYYSKLNIWGGTIESDSFAITGNGSTGQGYDEIYIYGGTITSTNAQAIYHPQQDGVMYVYGGTITGDTGIEVRGGTVVIDDDADDTAPLIITATGTDLSSSENYGGSTTSGAAVAIATYNLSDINVTINSGTLDGASSVYESNPNNYTELTKDVVVSITDGSFKGTVYSEDNVISITGGTYDSDVTAYCAEGYASTGEDGTYTVDAKGAAVIYDSEGTPTYYATIAAALDAAAEGQTIKLIRDVTEDVVVESGKNVVLDLNGYTLTNESTHTIINYGTLEITDSSAAQTGTVDCVTHACAALYNYGTITEISGGTFTRSAEEVEPSSNSWYTVVNVGTITTISGGTFTTGDGTSATLGNRSAVFRNGDGTTAGTIGEISGGTFIGAANIIKNESGSEIGTISGGTFTMDNSVNGWYGGNTMINNYGTIGSITGGTFSALGTGASANSSYSANSRYLLVTYSDVTISGVTMEMEGAQNVMVYASAGTASITSGSFTIEADESSLLFKVADGAAVAVSGGTFSEEVAYEYCADGFVPTKNDDGTYGVEKGEYVASITTDGVTTYYTSLAEAVEDAVSGDTVTLLADTDISTTGLTISSGKSITLDLNGCTIKAANTNPGCIVVYGDLTLKDSTDTDADGSGAGKIYTETVYTGSSTGYALIDVIGSFTMESGYIYAVIEDDPTNKGQFGIGSAAGGDITINGGKIEAGWYAVSGSGNDTTTSSTITINGGYLISTADYAIYHPQSGELIVNGGTIYGEAGGIQMNRGTLTVTGGTITSKGTGDTGTWGDGTGNTAAAALNLNAKYGDVTATVSGGTFIAETNALILTNSSSYTASLAISGGSFSSVVDAAYCADGYEPVTTVDENGYYTVELSNVAKVTTTSGETTYYATLADAVSAATDGDTITLLADTTLEAKLTISTTVTLELGGHTIDAGSYGIESAKNADLTVNNGSITGTTTGVLSKTTAGSLTLDSVKITNTKATSSYYALKVGISGNIINFKATNCTFTGSGSGVNLSCSKNVTDGSKFVLENCTISGDYYGVNILGGDAASVVEITGCKISNTRSSGYGAFVIGANSVGKVTVTETEITNSCGGNAVSIVATAGAVTVELGEGNVITGKVNLGNASSATSVSYTLNVTGGCFDNGSDNPFVDPTTSNSIGITDMASIKGGYYKLDISDYVAAGYVCESTDEKDNYLYKVQADTEYSKFCTYAEDGSVNAYYESISAALADNATAIYACDNDNAELTDEELTSLAASNASLSTVTGVTLTYSGTLAELLEAMGTTASLDGAAVECSDISLSNVSTSGGKLTGGTGFTSSDYESYASLLAEGYLFSASENYTIKSEESFAAKNDQNYLGYTTVQGALNSVYRYSGSTITVLKDVTESLSLVLKSDFTLDLNGKIITSTGTGFVIVYSTNTSPDGSVVTIKNGTITGTSYAIATNGTLSNVTLNLENVTATAGDSGVAVYLAAGGSTTITDCTISGGTGVQLCGGSLTITESEEGKTSITATGTDARGSKSGDGGICDGAAVSIVERDGYSDLGAVTITGGTFKSTNGDAVMAYNWSNDSYSDWSSDTGSIAISGGHYSSELEETYCANGYAPATETDEETYAGVLYTVQVAEYVASVTSGDITTEYTSLAKAFDAAVDGDTITLLKAIELTDDLTAAVDGSVTLDLAGLNLTIDSNVELTVNAGTTVTIKDSSNTGVVTNSGTITVNGTLDISALGYTTDGSTGGLMGQTSGKIAMGSAGTFVVPSAWETEWATYFAQAYNAGYAAYVDCGSTGIWSPNVPSATGVSGIFYSAAEGAVVMSGSNKWTCTTAFSNLTENPTTLCWTMELDFITATLIYKDIISIKYFFVPDSAYDENTATETGIAIWSDKDAAAAAETEPDETVSGWSPAMADDGSYATYNGRKYYYAVTDGIPAKNMGDMQYVRYYWVDDEGTTHYSNEICEYSPMTYAYNRLEKSDSDETKALAAALLNYGAAAQTYFEHDTDNLMNAGLSTYGYSTDVSEYYKESVLNDYTSYDTSKTLSEGSSENITLYARTTVFKGALQMNAYFSGLDGAANMGIIYWKNPTGNELSVSGKTGEITSLTQNGSYYYGTIEGIAAKDMSDRYYVCAYAEDSEGNRTYSDVYECSIYTYAYSRINNSGSAYMQALAKWLVVYGEAAKACLTSSGTESN